MYAVVEVQGKQYRAEKGAVLRVDHMDGEAGTQVTIDSVLLVSGDTISIGAPYVKGASIKASIKSQIKGDKVIVDEADLPGSDSVLRDVRASVPIGSLASRRDGRRCA